MDLIEYRAFQERAPDTERWELIAGVPLLVPLQTILHGRMVTDLANALDMSLRAAGADKMALQRIAVDMVSTDAIEAAHGIHGRCVPSPDVIVMDRAYEPDAWLASRAYLVGEVVGDQHDRRIVGDATWLDVKVACYMAHDPCRAIVIMDQGCLGLTLHLRDDDGWSTRTLGREDDLAIPGLGVSVPVDSISGWRPSPLRDGFPVLSAMAWAVIRCWEGQPEARLNAVADVALPLSRSTNRSVVPHIDALARAGLIVSSGGLRLTDAGRALLAADQALPLVETEAPNGHGAR